MGAEFSFASAGAWLATYWVHAAIAFSATFAAVHTLLRRAPAELRAAAWRAALVAPLLTATLRSGVFEHTASIEVAWLEADRSVQQISTEGVDESAVPTDVSSGPPSIGFATSLPRTERVGTPRVAPDSGRSSGALAPLDATAEVAALNGSVEGPTARPRSMATTLRERSRAEVPDAPSAPVAGTHVDTTATPSSTTLHVDPRRLALLATAIGVLLAVARWFDGWWRLGRHLGGRRPLAEFDESEARELARSMGAGRVRFSESDAIAVPMAFGFVRPEVCLPTDFGAELTRDEWRAAVAHEVAHHVRGDACWLPVLRVLSRALSFQPLNVLAWRALQRESELAADELAVRHTDGAEALALCLAKVAARVSTRHAQLPAAAMTGAPTMAVRPALVVERAEKLVASIGMRAARTTRVARAAALLPTVLVAGLAPRLSPLLAAEADQRPQARLGAFSDEVVEELGLPSMRIDANSAVGTESPVAIVARELAHEFAAARAELEGALATAEGERLERLTEIAERLQLIESRAALLESIAHGLDARAKAETSATSPDNRTERETD